MKPDIRKKIKCLKIRSLVVQAIRDFFSSQNFLEVDTPVRSPVVIPEAQIEPVCSEDKFLQASPELCMKRLLSQGFDHIFQMAKTFRRGERGDLHLPEFTLLEWYAPHCTYLDLMEVCQALIRFIGRRLGHTTHITYQGTTISLSSPWKKLTVADAFNTYSDISVKSALDKNRFDEIISFQIEPNLGMDTPVFLMDYPARMASLAQLKPSDPEVAQRVELYLAGIELANGFTELTDPVEQRSRFEKENAIRRHQNLAALPMPEKFLASLEFMPPAAGMALGVDRLVMLFADAACIDEVVAFTPEAL